ncbi:MAG: hypothetical protein M3174_07095 [Actinomycetota bacterium]|nr:hypothetical protein [Actinomycetota bacterium]
MRRILTVVLAGALLVGLAGIAPAGKTKNIKRVARVAYKGGSHLTFGNGYAYGGELNGVSGRDEAGYEDKGGVRIFDITGRPRQAGFFHCPGNDLDVAYMKPGVIAVGYHKALCTEPGEGLFTLDVSNPKKPKMMDYITFPATFNRNHAIARYPGKPLVYAAGGGLGRGQETVTIVDVSNPRKLKIASSYLALPRGCHDISFHFDKTGKYAFCSGLGETQVWDVSKPLAPEVISRIHNPAIQFQHYAVASDDGKILVINDENITANDCVPQETPTGAIWIYDISDKANPELQSYFSPRRGAAPIGSFESPSGTCTSHDFNFMDNRTVVVPFYTGGFSIINLKNPSNPKEVAYYQPKGTNMWSAHWYKGRIYTNDMGRGFEALEVKMKRGTDAGR